MLKLRLGLTAVLVVANQAALSATDVSGRWAGTMVCPGSTTEYRIDVTGQTGTVHYSVYTERTQGKPTATPISVRVETGHEGEWVYFSNGKLDMATFNGLLSRDGKSISVRSKVFLGECTPFMLAKTATSTEMDASIKELEKPPHMRAPSEAEMRTAVDNRLQEEMAAFYAAIAPIGSHRFKVSRFRKVECRPPVNKAYVCRYTMVMENLFEPLSSERSHREFAESLNKVHDYFGKGLIGDPFDHTTAFTYDASTKQWVRAAEPKFYPRKK